MHNHNDQPSIYEALKSDLLKGRLSRSLQTTTVEASQTCLNSYTVLIEDLYIYKLYRNFLSQHPLMEVSFIICCPAGKGFSISAQCDSKYWGDRQEQQGVILDRCCHTGGRSSLLTWNRHFPPWAGAALAPSLGIGPALLSCSSQLQHLVPAGKASVPDPGRQEMTREQDKWA